MSTMTMPMKPQPEAAARAQQPASPVLEIRGLSAGYASAPVIRDVRMDIGRGLVTAIIGPSGCGKSTLIRCLNRMHEIIPGAFCEGDVRLEGHDVFRMDPVHLRRQVGMVFQRPNPFPTMSVYENVASGLRLNGVRDRKLTAERVEKSLRQAALWDEVKDRLAMLQAATKDEARFAVSRAELDRPSPSYTVDTLEALASEGRLYLILGSDAVAELDRWRDVRRILELATLLVAARPSAPELPTGRPVDLLDAPCLDISSRELRARAARGRSLRYLVPDAVWRYIEQRGLYRAGVDPSPAT